MPTTSFHLPALATGPADPQQPDYRLSDCVARFFLLSADAPEPLPIQEPIGFDGAEWTLERDKDWHGINFEFNGQQTQLTFREPAAVAFLQNQYQAHGPAATVVLDWQLIDPVQNERLSLQQLKINFSGRQTHFGGSELTLPGERVSLHPDIRAHWDTIISLNQKTALISDNNGVPLPVTPPVPVSLILHAQRIRATTTVKPEAAPADTDWQSFVNRGGTIFQGNSPLNGVQAKEVYRDFYLSFPLSAEKAAPAEIDGYVGSYTGVAGDTPAPILTAKQEGHYTIDLTWDFQVDARLQTANLNLVAPKIKSYVLNVLAKISNQTSTRDLGVTQGDRVNGRQLGARRLLGGASLSLDLQIGDTVIVYGYLSIDVNRDNWRGTDVRLLVNSATISVVANTTAPPSTAPAYTVPDMLNHLVACLSGRPGIVRSSYYSRQGVSQPVDGGGSHRLLTSGFLLRNFLTKPAQATLQNVLTGLSAIDAIGFSYRPGPAGDLLVVEPALAFYRPVEMMRFDSCQINAEQTEPDYLPSKVIIGYQKYPDAGPQVLDDFNTQHEYVLPALQTGEVYSRLSSLIASGYAIEQTRRAQFSKSPTDSTSYDDDLFIICASPEGALTAGSTAVTLPVQFGVVGKKAALLIAVEGAPAWLAKGVSFVVSPAASVVPATQNAGIYTVTDRVSATIAKTITVGGGFSGFVRRRTVQVPAHGYILDRTVIPELASVQISVNGSGNYQAERDESFAAVSGVLDPATTYNLRLSPRFNLLRHAPLLSGALIYQSGSEVIRHSFTKNNGSLKTQLKSTAAGDLNIDIRRPITHADSLYVADLRQPLPPIWKPETMTVETRLSIDQMLYLRACLQGYHPDPTLHYGYVTVFDADGTGVPLFPLKISYQPASGKCTLTGIKKFVPSSQPTGQRGCQFYSGFTFADFELAKTNGTLVDAWVEGCQFDNFG